MEWILGRSVLLLIGLSAFCWWQNNGLVTTQAVYQNSKIPAAFSGLRIVHLSDVHNKAFGKGQNRLLKRIKVLSPHCIFITGDLIDRRRCKLKPALELVKGLVPLCPVYYVPGNHEAWCVQYEPLKQELLRLGVTLLENEKVYFSRKGEKLAICGVLDLGFYNAEHAKTTDTVRFEQELHRLLQGEEFHVLLSHRPERFNLYVQAGADLVFSGHAHGGQFRLPFIGGLFAPTQGFFPKYTSGSHQKGKTTLFISRGLGNSQMPLRLFNRPEILCVTLQGRA